VCALALAAFAGATVAGGSTWAATTTLTSSRQAARAPGPVHILDYSINSDGPGSQVILTGAVGDYGRAASIYPDGKLDPDHNGEMELKLTHGSFRLGVADLEKQIVSAFTHWPSHKNTCSGSISLMGSVPIVAGSGTGLYKGISGSFNMSVNIYEVDVKPVCNGTSKFLSQAIVISGSGNVSFG
jgi:hypothetical protein